MVRGDTPSNDVSNSYASDVRDVIDFALIGQSLRPGVGSLERKTEELGDCFPLRNDVNLRIICKHCLRVPAVISPGPERSGRILNDYLVKSADSDVRAQGGRFVKDE